MVGSFFKLKKRLIIFSAVFLLFFFLFPALIFSDNDVNLPSYTGYINDYAGKLDESSRSSLEELASGIENDTGSEIVVVIVDNLQGLTEEEYSVKLFEEWGIGKKEKDNGILILIGIEGEVGSRPLRIEVGYGLEGVITDLEAGRIEDDIIVPNLIKDDFYTGLYNAITAIADQIYEEEGLPPPGFGESVTAAGDDTGSAADFFSGFFWIWICCFPIPLIAVIIILLVYFFKKRCPQCRKFALRIKTTVLKKATYTETGKKLIERTCSNCGYSDTKEVVIPKKSKSSHWTGGGTGSSRSSGGGFGGFGGGSSGGGGASRGW